MNSKETDKISICAPLKDYWCVECCPESCCNLQDLPDGTRRCAKYDQKSGLIGFPRDGKCLNFKCWQGMANSAREYLTAEEILKSIQEELIRQTRDEGRIRGEFSISELYSTLNLHFQPHN